jgi:cysteine desulfuration protein SufE
MSLPQKLQTIVTDFKSAPKPLRLQMLLEFSKKVPPLPAHLANNSEALERVHECQTPFFLATEYPDDQHVIFHFDAPPEAPTTRGFAGILSEGLNGSSPQEILDVPSDFYTEMGLDEVISPLRLRGMSGIIGRIKRQVEEHQKN